MGAEAPAWLRKAVSVFGEECKLKLARDHMRELRMIYGGELHL